MSDYTHDIISDCTNAIRNTLYHIFDRGISLKITNFYNFPPPLATLLQRQNQRGTERWDTWHIWGKRDGKETVWKT